MRIAKSAKWLLILSLVSAAVVCLFFVRMYSGDIKALKSFTASYADFDKAITSYADGGGDYALVKAGEASIELQTRSSLRLSSLIKNDAELMEQAREVAGLSRRELAGLKALGALPGDQNHDPDGLVKTDETEKERGILHDRRRAAYARFQELGAVR